MKNNHYCPTCQGRGWYEGPYYGNLQPSVEMMVCEDCNTVGKPLEPMPRFAKILISGLFALLVVLLIGSFR